MAKSKMHVACPCGKSSDAYCYYEDGHEFCYSCKKFVGNGKKEPEELCELSGTDYRGIEQRVLDIYGVKTYGDTDGNVLYRVYHDATNGASKVRRTLDKNFRQRNGRMSGLFGSWLFNQGCSHYVTVVEGEEDCLAAFQMLNTTADGKPSKTLHPVVAIPGSGISKQDRHAVYTYLSSFETVKLAIEDDEAGKQAKVALANMLPNKIREVKLTKYKDANEYLVQGDNKEFTQAWHNAKVYTPDNVFHTDGDIEAILADEQTESVVPTNITALDEKIKGLALNHVTLITAMEGMGKTELLRKFEYEVVKSGVSIGVLHFEETKAKMVRALACYEAKENMRQEENKKKVAEYWRKLSNDFENVYIFEFKRDPSVQEVVDQINYLVYVCGVRYVFIDPINQFDPVDDTSKVDFLDDLSKKLEKYVCQHPVGLVWTAHVDDEGRTRNSRMISKACSTRIDLFRDHLSEDEGERNKLGLVVSKNRQFGETGPAGLAYFMPDTFTIEDGGKEIEVNRNKVIPF